METNKEIQNQYAYNKEMVEIFISKAESGLKGYFCLGCKRPMVAVHNPPHIKSYFRHHHNGSNGLTKCNYSDETYRHKLAKDLLATSKRVKVPPIYKDPPNGINGIPNLLSDEKFIVAYHVESEISFYEDDKGEICWNKNSSNSENKYLLIKPDVVFFDNELKPILLIEIVATHKITDEKKRKLKRLGIDSIKISIPQEAPEIIKETLESTNRTKWIYNYEQEIAEYIPISYSPLQGIPSIDKEQRKLYEESFECRVTQINDLIRTIDRLLESEQYRAIARDLESEISRVTGNTERQRESLEELREENDKRIRDIQNEIRGRVNPGFRERRERITRETTELEEEEAKFRLHCVEENKKYESEIGRHRNRIEQSISDRIRSEERNLEERYTRKDRQIKADSESEQRTFRDFEEQRSTINGNIERERGNNKKFRIQAEQLERKIENECRLEGEEQNRINRNNKNRSEIEERSRTARLGLEEKFASSYREFSRAIETGEYLENEHSKRFKGLFDDLDKAADFSMARERLNRNKKAWDCFTREAYNNWHD